MQKSLRYIAIGALFLIPIFPLIIANPLFFPFITGKAFFFRILVEIALCSWIVLAFFDAKYRPKFTPLTVTITLFAVVTLLADLLGVNPVRSLLSNFERMEGWLVIAHLWAFYITAAHVFGPAEEGKRIWHRWLNTSLVVAGIICLYAIGQLFGWFEIHQGSVRLDASLGNAIYLAVYLLMHLGFAVYLFRHLRLSFMRHIVAAICGVIAVLLFAVPIFGSYVLLQNIIGLVFLAVSIGFSPYVAFVITSAFIIIETQTRGTMIGLGIGLIGTCAMYALFAGGVSWKKIVALLSFPFIAFLYGLFVLALGSFEMSIGWLALIALIYFIALIVYVAVDKENIHDPKVRRGRWIGISIIALTFILGGAFYLVKDAAFVKNSPALNRIASISLTDTKTQARAYIWPMALEGFTERPILGWGQENFNYIFNAHYNPKMWSQEQWFDRAHSVYLDWLVASGAVGLIVYLAIFVLAIWTVWRSTVSLAEKSTLTGLIVAYGIHNFFVFDNLASYAFFFALLGFIGTLRANNPKQAKVFSTDAVEYVVLPITIIALVAGLYFLNIRPIQANTRLIDALISCSSGQTLPDPNLFSRALGVSAMADQEVREQILSCAGGVISRGYPGPTKQAFYDLSLREIKAQIARAPGDARMYVLGGMFLNNVGQMAEALDIMEKAHKLTPAKQTVSIQLATDYLYASRNEEGLALLKEAYESDPTFDDARSAYILGLVLTGRDADARAVASSSTALLENDRIARAYASLKKYDKSIAVYKKLVEKDPKSVPLRAQLAEVYAAAGMKWQAIEALRSISKDFPEYKDQVEAAIKQVETQKTSAY